MLQNDHTLTQKELAKQENVDHRYMTRALHLLLLAPDIMTSILKGTQPEHFTLTYFRTVNLPICWQEQRELLRFNTQ